LAYVRVSVLPLMELTTTPSPTALIRARENDRCPDISFSAS
jgi:hypothetical protein